MIDDKPRATGKVCVVSNGLRHGTFVWGPNGEPLHEMLGVLEIEWDMRDNGLARLTLRCRMATIELEAELLET